MSRSAQAALQGCINLEEFPAWELLPGGFWLPPFQVVPSQRDDVLLAVPGGASCPTAAPLAPLQRCFLAPFFPSARALEQRGCSAGNLTHSRARGWWGTAGASGGLRGALPPPQMWRGCSSKSFKLYSPKEPPNGNAFPPFHPGTMLDRDVGPTPMYPPTYLEPGIGRHTPYGNQTDYRIFELNKRLQNWTEECDNLWWDAFTTEFFEDDAMLTITFCLEDGPKRYTIGRTLIPRYFRSIFEGGATELYYVLKHPKESFHNNFVSLDCDQCTMVTQHGKPMFTQVCVEGRLYLEFMFDDMMRIKTWHFSIRQHRELIPRSILAMHAQDPQMLDQLSKNITRCGLSNSTLNYLRLCVILEPMQELMSRHKTYSLSPRDCLKTCLFQKWQRMVAPPAEPARQQPSKRRKRKMSGGSTMSSGGGNTNNSNSKKKSPASTFALSSQDVMVVGEPTLMGGEFGDEDERLITRLENTQFDAANGIDDEDSFNNSPALGANSPWNSKPPSSQESKSENPTSQASQ
ncbi:LIM domain-binding protein 1 isoform 2-T2 [Cyanocitta cristata]